ncbi:MAG: LysM peptidoglycan-binding domain-containing protein [Actinobacteria bacterium]|nr:LysM peptidoglycan-binding domain-containing protein [Actinomycetota bacterium]
MSQSARQPHETKEVQRRPVEWDRTSPPVKVLWGRVAALAATIIIAYLIGRATGPQGVPVEELGQAQTELAAAQERITQLETRLEETTAPENARPVPQGADETGEPQAQPPDGNEGEDAPAAGREAPAEGAQAPQDQPGSARTYVVQDGDSLNSIAGDFYGDASLVGLIARANNITAQGQIRAGQKLELPPKP